MYFRNVSPWFVLSTIDLCSNNTSKEIEKGFFNWKIYQPTSILRAEIHFTIWFYSQFHISFSDFWKESFFLYKFKGCFVKSCVWLKNISKYDINYTCVQVQFSHLEQKCFLSRKYTNTYLYQTLCNIPTSIKVEKTFFEIVCFTHLIFLQTELFSSICGHCYVLGINPCIGIM